MKAWPSVISSRLMVLEPGGSASSISFTLLYMVTRIGVSVSAPRSGPMKAIVSVMASSMISARLLTGPVVGDGDRTVRYLFPLKPRVVVYELGGFGGKFVAFGILYQEVVGDYRSGRDVPAPNPGAPEEFGFHERGAVEFEVFVGRVLVASDLQPDRDFLYLVVALHLDRVAHSFRKLADYARGKYPDAIVFGLGEGIMGVSCEEYQRDARHQEQ